MNKSIKTLLSLTNLIIIQLLTQSCINIDKFLLHSDLISIFLSVAKQIPCIYFGFYNRYLGVSPKSFFSKIVKPAHAVTCIKRSPFSCPVIENFIWIEPLLRGHLSYKASFSVSQRWPLNTGLTIFQFGSWYLPGFF